MRISDWSSDVCSSDLGSLTRIARPLSGGSCMMRREVAAAGRGRFRTVPMAAVAAEPASNAGYGRGIALQVVAVAMFTCMGMIIKLLDGRYPTSQIILFRCAPALLPLLLYLPMQGGWSALKTRRPGWHLIRTVAGLGSMYVGFYAIARMAFADYVAI